MAPESLVHTLPLTQGQLSYLKAGAGPAVVIAHGIGGHKEDWRDAMEALSVGHTVYAIDMIGFGGSPSDAPEITIASQAAAILALLDAESIATADLIGNSVGGWVAATFAAAYPDRIRRLVLVDAAGFKAMFEGPSPVNFYPDTVADMQKLLSFVRHAADAHGVAAAERALSTLKASGDASAADRIFAGMFASERLEDVADKIVAPSLIVWGANDALFPSAIADLIAGRVRQAKKVLIAEAGHFPHLDNPSAFHAAIASFLND